MSLLTEIAVFLAAAVIAVPLFRRLGLGAILGYLAAGVAIGPWALGLSGDVEDVLHFGEIGVVFLLFIIGLELQPARLRAMRRTIFLPGALQVIGTSAVLAFAGRLLGLHWTAAVVVGLALSLSSTAFVLQMLAERRTLKSAHGRAAFGILLFQDIAVIPMIALMPFLAPGNAPGSPTEMALETGKVVIAVAGFIFGGRILLRHVFRIVAQARQSEVFTAAALLLVLGAAMLMDAVGVSMGLGAFIAGVLVADSEYRHQLEADIEPFKGLLLGLFFMAVGMRTNLGLLFSEPVTVFLLAAGLMVAKAAVIAGIGRLQRLRGAEAPRLGANLAQGGEFAFVLMGAAAGHAVLPRPLVDLLTLVVTVSMAATPAITALLERLLARSAEPPAFDEVEERDHEVIIAGFGRFGQVVARLLASRRIRFTALEANPTQVDFVRQYGNRIYYGDASNFELLRSAHIERARVFVLAVDDMETSMKIARVVRRHFPDLKLYARARNRHHAHRLMDLGCTAIVRETFLSSLWLGGEVLKGLGLDSEGAEEAKDLFRGHDEKTLARQYAIRNDREALIQSHLEAARELRELFEADAGKD